MTLMQLRYFLEVSKTRHFTAAANNLYVAQSSLSHAIHELENELGVPLFIRCNNKNVSLSNYGQAFLPYVEKIMQTLEEGQNEVEGLKSPLYGKVKISFFFSVALTTIPFLTRRFRSDNPDNHIKLSFEVNHNWSDLKDLLIRGRCDLVISCNELSSNIESRQFGFQKIILIVSKDHPFASRESVTIQEIAGENIIAIDPNSNLDCAIKNMFSSEGITPKITYVTDWTSSQLHISVGDGIGFSTDVPVDEKFLKKIPVDHPGVLMPLYISWAKNRKLSQATTFYRDYLLKFAMDEGMDKLIF